MTCEILEYRYNLGWNLDTLLGDESFKEHLSPKYPLVVSNFSALRSDSQTKSWIDFFANKRRGRPSDLRSLSEDSVVSYVSEKLNLRNQVFRVSAECASSLYAFYVASLISKEQNTPVVVFCGDNKVANYDTWYFGSFGALDNSTGRPFDTTSKGFKMGSCSTLFLVKDSSVSLYNNDAKMVIEKFFFYTNAANTTNPGSVDEILENLDGINYKSIEFWNAHATGTPVGDKFEYEMFSKTISQDIPIVSYKGYLGHCMGGAGAMELIYSFEDKHNGVLRPNYITGDKIHSDSRIITDPLNFKFNKMLKVSLGFGGKTCVAEINLP